MKKLFKSYLENKSDIALFFVHLLMQVRISQIFSLNY